MFAGSKRKLETDSYVVKCWLVGCFVFYGPLRQYFSLYRAVPQREGARGERIDESKNVQTTPTRTYCKCNRPLPYCYQNCRTPRHWKFTQHHHTTRPPPYVVKMLWCTYWRFGDLENCLNYGRISDTQLYKMERLGANGAF